MKKFKFIATFVIAGSLLLSGCGKKHTHVDSNSDFVCDECGESLQGIESISIICEESVLENEKIELNAEVVVHDVSNAISWSVNSNDGSAEIVFENGVYYLKGLKEGLVVVRATSIADSSKFAEKTIEVYSNGFAPELIDLGMTYSKSFPVDELKKMFGNETNIFIPSDDICERGLYYIHSDGTDSTYESFLIIYNLNAAKASEDPDIARLGSKLDSEYYETDYLYSFQLEDSNIGFIDDSFTYEFDTTFIGNYYSMFWYRVSDIFEDETKTENSDWTDKQKEDMQSILHGQVIPFIKMGASYGYDLNTTNGYINFFDYCCDYRICEEYKTILLDNGFSYSNEIDAFYKKLADNIYLYVETYFDEYGNEIYAYVDSETLFSWPAEVVNDFVLNELNSEYSIPAFNYESESKLFKYIDNSDYINPQFVVSTQYASYDNTVLYINSLINEHDFKLVNTVEFVTIFLDDPHSCDGKFSTFELQKGYIDLRIIINPVFKPDATFNIFPSEFYFDYCNVKFEISHSGGYEVKGIYINDNKQLNEGEKLSLELGEDYALDIVKCKLSQQAEVTIESSNNDIVTVSDTGVITPVGIGQAKITVKAVDEGVAYEDTIDVIVDYKSVYEEIYISDYINAISSTGTLTFEEAGIECVVEKGTGKDFILDSENGTLTLNEGNTISFTIRDNEKITKVGFGDAISNDAVLSANTGESVKNAWYATDEVNTFVLVVESGQYTFSSISVLTNNDLLPVPSLATAKSLADELATCLEDWWVGRDIVIDDTWDTDIYVSFIWDEYIPSESGFDIEEAFEYCITYNVLYMFSEDFAIDDLFYDVDDDGYDYASAMCSTADGSFYLFITLTVDTTSDEYSVICEILEF